MYSTGDQWLRMHVVYTQSMNMHILHALLIFCASLVNIFLIVLMWETKLMRLTRKLSVSISSVHHCPCMDVQCSGLFFFCYLHLLPHIFLGFQHQAAVRRRQSGPQWWPPGRLWGQFILDLENWTRLWLIDWVPCSFYATLYVSHGEEMGLIFLYVLATQ